MAVIDLINNAIENKSPIFDQSTYRIIFNEQTTSNDALGKVVATDEDKCEDCDCGQIIYSILDESAKEIFDINSNTGELRVIPNKSVPKEESSFIVKATNKSPFDKTYDTATIFITPTVKDDSILERYRRAVRYQGL